MEDNHIKIPNKKKRERRKGGENPQWSAIDGTQKTFSRPNLLIQVKVSTSPLTPLWHFCRVKERKHKQTPKHQKQQLEITFERMTMFSFFKCYILYSGLSHAKIQTNRVGASSWKTMVGVWATYKKILMWIT